MIWFTLLLVGVSFLLTALLAPKPKLEDARASNLDDLRFPTAREGAPLGLALGTVRMRAPNTLWYGDFESRPIKEKVKTGLFSSKRVTVGYKYYVGFQLGLALGPGCALKRIWIDKDEVWSGYANTDGQVVSINKPSLFGGHKEGGGFVGNLRFYTGSFTQPQNAYLVNQTKDPQCPAYVGLCHVVFEKPYIGETAQLRPLSFEIERLTNGLGLSEEQRVIGDGDLNGAELLYQIMTLEWGGLGLKTSDIDLVSFFQAGVKLAEEGNGMSLLITKANGGKDAVNEVLRQINGVLYQDPTTGRIVLRLIRFDYEIEDLDILDPTNVISVRDFSRTSWEDTFNQVRVTYTNRSNKYETGVAIVQDMANINSQGRLRSTNISFPGVSNGTLAVQLATRELTQLSVPLFKVRLEVDRKAANLRPGDPFVFSWPEYGIEQVVMRVQRFNLGELVDGRVVIDALQDEFATDLTVFAPPEDTNWEPIDRSAKPITEAVIWESPYFITSRQELVTFPPTGQRSYVFIMAEPANAYQQGFSATIGDTKVIDRESYPTSAELDDDLSANNGFDNGNITSLNVRLLGPNAEELTNVDFSDMQQGANLFLIDDELFMFQTITDNGNGTWTLGNVYRGLLDTIPADHAVGSKVWFITIDMFATGDFPGTGLLTAALQSFTDKDEVPIENADTFQVSLDRRWERPLRPAYVRLNGSRTPPDVTTVGPHTVSWRPRNRTSATIQVENESGNQEANVTYTLRVYLNGTEVVSKRQTGITTDTAMLTLDSGMSGDMRLEVSSVLNGLESRTAAYLLFDVEIP